MKNPRPEIVRFDVISVGTQSTVIDVRTGREVTFPASYGRARSRAKALNEAASDGPKSLVKVLMGDEQP